MLPRLAQSPRDPAFVQDPYSFYDRARGCGELFWWEEYGVVCASTYRGVMAILKDRRFGREAPPGCEPAAPPHLEPFVAFESRSMLEREPPVHTCLRGHVSSAFTARAVADLEPGISDLCHRLIDGFPRGPFDLLAAYAEAIPIAVITELLGVPADRGAELLAWSHAMVAMYQARRTRAVEDAAVAATLAFGEFMAALIAERQRCPGDELLSRLVTEAVTRGELSPEELSTTCILLLNAGHEATAKSLGNAVKALLEAGLTDAAAIDAAMVDELLRVDPPLHMFSRWVTEELSLFGHHLRPGDRVACLLGAAARDPAVYPDPGGLDPGRVGPPNPAFGAGIHYCLGAPLARLELRIALRTLLERCPDLRLAEAPRYADIYHFHGLERLMVTGS